MDSLHAARLRSPTRQYAKLPSNLRRLTWNMGSSLAVPSTSLLNRAEMNSTEMPSSSILTTVFAEKKWQARRPMLFKSRRITVFRLAARSFPIASFSSVPIHIRKVVKLGTLAQPVAVTLTKPLALLLKIFSAFPISFLTNTVSTLARWSTICLTRMTGISLA